MGYIIEIYIRGNKTNAQLVWDSIEFTDDIMDTTKLQTESISDMRIIKDEED